MVKLIKWSSGRDQYTCTETAQVKAARRHGSRYTSCSTTDIHRLTRRLLQQPHPPPADSLSRCCHSSLFPRSVYKHRIVRGNVKRRLHQTEPKEDRSRGERHEEPCDSWINRVHHDTQRLVRSRSKTIHSQSKEPPSVGRRNSTTLAIMTRMTKPSSRPSEILKMKRWCLTLARQGSNRIESLQLANLLVQFRRPSFQSRMECILRLVRIVD